MQLVAVVGSGPTPRALARYRDPEAKVWLQALPESDVDAVLGALVPMGFAGALVFGDDERHVAARAVTRRSVGCERFGCADAVSVAAGGTIGDWVGGRAVAEGMRSAGWDPRGARIVALGTGPSLSTVVAELAESGAEEVTFVARHPVEGERAVPLLPHGVSARVLSARDAGVASVMSRCDVLLRADDLVAPEPEWLGPHLTVVDLSPTLPPRWRSVARAAGATAISWPDVEAHRVSAMLRTVVGGAIDPQPLLDLLHEA